MLFKPERIPPHIGLIANNQFFDLNVKGKNVAAQLNDERLFSATNAFLALKLNLNENSEFLSPFFAKYIPTSILFWQTKIIIFWEEGGGQLNPYCRPHTLVRLLERSNAPSRLQF